MYLRSNGTKNNPGRHPIGVIGVLKFEDCVQVAIATIHSEDRFVKEDGKNIVRAKMHAGNVAMIGTESPVNLHFILPRGVAKRLDNYERHQEIFELLVKDEMEDGTWSKQNRDLVKHIDEAYKVRAEHGCAP
jgi:hypothetical protein